MPVTKFRDPYAHLAPPGKLLALDPGLRECGVAVFAQGTLVDAGLVKNTFRRGGGLDAIHEMVGLVTRRVREGGPFDRVVVEVPQIYMIGKGKGDPNDLLALAQIGACVGWALRAVGPKGNNEVVQVRPAEWKAQMDKDVCRRRILGTHGVPGRLDELEMERLAPALEEAGAKDHNVVDAVGIGLHSLGRFERRRVITR